MKTASGTFAANNMNHHNCNVALHGNLEEYRKHLLKDIGQDGINKLEQNKNKKIPTPELKEMLENVKSEYKKIVEEKKKVLYN